jgi:hypothetical protein
MNQLLTDNIAGVEVATLAAIKQEFGWRNFHKEKASDHLGRLLSLQEPYSGLLPIRVVHGDRCGFAHLLAFLPELSMVIWGKGFAVGPTPTAAG